MLTSYFDIKTEPKADAQPFGRRSKQQQQPSGRRAATAAGRKKQSAKSAKPAKDPRPTEAATTSVHARFVPLPPETNVPRPAETPTQAWQALGGSGVVRDDDFAEWQDDQPDDDQQAGWDEDAQDELDELSEPDFEPESLDPLVDGGMMELESSLSSSVGDDDRAVHAFFRRHRACAPQSTPVYSGPQLCCEDDDFDD